MNKKVTGCYEGKKYSSVHTHDQMVTGAWFETYNGSTIG